MRYWHGYLSGARCHPIISCSSKIQNGLPFWCRLTQIVLEIRPLHGCSSSSSSVSSSSSNIYRSDTLSSSSNSLYRSDTLPVGKPAVPEYWWELRLLIVDPLTEGTSHPLHHLFNTGARKVMPMLAWTIEMTTPQWFYGTFFGTIRMSQCQKKTSGLYGARQDNKKQTCRQSRWAPLHPD